MKIKPDTSVCKDTNLKANHNEETVNVDNRDAVFPFAKILI